MARVRGATVWKVSSSLLVLGGLGFLVLTSPWTWSMLHGSQELPPLEGADVANGRRVFVASDCATCHATPGQPKDTVLGGGRALDTAFGIFHMPNISPDKQAGIGNWTLAQFDRALRQGVGPGGFWPDGQVLYPSFPYTSYQKLKGSDVRDLYAYMMTLPPVAQAAPDHELKFPFSLRRGVGLWRLAFLDGRPWQPGPVPAGVKADDYHRGEYLVEAAGHCAECHSTRTFMGNVKAGLRYAGGPTPEGNGWFPNVTPDETGIGYWSVPSIASYLQTGVNPIGRVADGDMAEVIRNTAQLPAADVEAMALYLKHVPAVTQPAPGMPMPNHGSELVMLPSVVQHASRLPVSGPDSIRAGEAATVVRTTNAWLQAGGVQKGAEAQAKLLGGAAVQVKARDGDRVQLVLQGWQIADTPSVVYQARGQRVMVGVLTPEAVAAVKHGEAETDADTGQRWLPGELTVWAEATGLNTDRPAVWAYSQDVFQKACSACHVLPQKGHFTANQWIGTLKSMRRFTTMDDDQYRLILAYLQNHSKDLKDPHTQGGAAAAGGHP